MISTAHLARIVEQARAEYPNEACGLLASLDDVVREVYPITNADASPVHYTMDSQEQLRATLDIEDRGWDLGAIYHSHTHTRPYPSPTDVRMAFYPDSLYIIVSLASREPEIRAYRIQDEVISEVELSVIDETALPD